jgi:hypothetical protein
MIFAAIMQKKGNLNPPSQNNTGSLAGKKARIAALEGQLDQLKSELNREQGDVIFNTEYERSLTRAAETLKINRNDLAGAYDHNKGALVSSFKQTQKRGDYPPMVACGATAALFSLGTVLVMIENPKAWPLLGATMFGSWVTGLAIRDGLRDYRKTKNARAQIQNRVAEYKKQLPPPKV